MPDPGLFRRAVEARDLDQVMAAFAPGAVLHSPITHQPFVGCDTIRGLLAIILEVFGDLRYTEELESADGTRALVFRATVAGLELEGLDLLRFDASGRIADFTVMVRPRSALEALLAEMAPRLAPAVD